MNRFWIRLKLLDQQLFVGINTGLHHSSLNFLLFYLTNIGGATFTILSTLAIWAFTPEPWSTAGLSALTALSLSHIPVMIAKKTYPRVRPYLALPGTRTFPNPLKDHSFPSGHTTAIFSVTVPFIVLNPWLGLGLLPLALIIAISRIYLGLHYPSDVLAGGIIGTLVALGTVALWP